MALLKRVPAFLLLLAAPLPALAAPAGPGWSFLEARRVEATLQSGEAGEGTTAQLNLPLSSNGFLVGTGLAIDAHFTDPASANEEYRSYSGGIGLHDDWGRAHGFGSLGYIVSKRHIDKPSPGIDDREYGPVLTLGVRVLAQPWLSLEPEATFAAYTENLRLNVGLRLVPHLWLVGGYSVGAVFGDRASYSLGLRLMAADSSGPPKKSRGARPADANDAFDGDIDLVAGMTLTALRPLRLQVRPRFGAPESVVVPRGATLILQKTESNDFGRWWYVSADGKEGWIREGELQ